MSEIKLIYKQIKEYIEKEARSKRPGEFLESENAYSQRYKISRPTVRKAVSELIGEGIVERIPGKGIIVADPKRSSFKGTLIFLIHYFPDDGLFFNMVMGCVNAANKCGYNYKIINIPSSKERLDVLRSLNLKDFAGVVLTAYENEYDYGLLDTLSESGCPYILVDNPIKDRDDAHVITNDYLGGYLSGGYLANRGHKEILYLTLDSNNHTIQMRKKGFIDALANYDIDLPEEYVIKLKHDNEITNIIKDVNLDYTAICGYSDIPIIMVYEVLRDKGVKIPNEVSLLGYGNFRYSEMLTVPLTTISMPVYDMGYRAVEILVEGVQGKRSIENIILDVNIIERSSVADLKKISPEKSE